MLRVFSAILFSWMSLISFSQNDKEKILLNKVSSAVSEAAKIDALNELADYYFIFKLDKKADSVLNSELLIAEMSSNKELIFHVLFNNVITNMGSWASAESFARTSAFLDKGLYHAKESSRNDYQAIAYIRKASLLKKMKEYDKAIEQATLAFSSLGNNNNFDSLKITLYLELGDILLGKGNAVSAYQNYNNAYDLAYTIKNFVLQSETYHRFAALYFSMGNKELAKESLFKSRDLNLKYNNETGLVKDYIHLARFTDEKEYIIKAEQQAEKVGMDFYRIFSKRLMHAYIMVVEKNCDKALSYLEENKDYKQVTINQGISTYYYTIGNIYKYCGKQDSALRYYNLAEPEFKKTFDKGNLQIVYKDIAECYDYTNKYDAAIKSYEQSLSISRELNNLNANASISLALSKLYPKIGDYKNAFEYSKQHLVYRDSLQKLTTQRDVALLEVQREELQHEKDMRELQKIKERKRNLQYVSISVAITGLFFFMILIGMFPVSRFVIKLLGYFSFICLFEFFVLLLDTYLHDITHGEPLKIWMIKIFIIALMVPFQHFLEHGMIKFLESKRLIKMRSRFSLKKILAGFGKTKRKPSVKIQKGFEEDTAVL